MAGRGGGVLHGAEEFYEQGFAPRPCPAPEHFAEPMHVDACRPCARDVLRCREKCDLRAWCVQKMHITLTPNVQEDLHTSTTTEAACSISQPRTHKDSLSLPCNAPAVPLSLVAKAQRLRPFRLGQFGRCGAHSPPGRLFTEQGGQVFTVRS